MKTFRYPKGNEAKTTVTVKELIEILQEYPDEMPVFFEWETVYAPFKSCEVEEDVHWGFMGDASDCLIINVNDY